MPGPVLEFADFRLDCDHFELCRANRVLKLERMPMELLIFLATREGDVVTRAEIAEHLWGSEVFVDTEHGINTAIRKVRQALRDDPDQPRFVQTVTGRGYRFVGPVAPVPSPVPNNPPAKPAETPLPLSAVKSAIPTDGEQIKTPRRSRPGLWLTFGLLAALLLVAVAITFRLREHPSHAAVPPLRSLAVLPLENLSGDPKQDYFAEGMTDELTTMLAKDSTLRVISRTSAMQFKDPHRPLRDVATSLGVDGIVEGSISRADNKVHMTVQLIHAPSDTHLWADSYDRDKNDVAALPAEAALAIAKRLNASVAILKPVRYINPEAHDAYLRGRYYWFGFHRQEAAEYFRKAIKLQPDYALGWVGLSDYYGEAAVDGALPPGEAKPQAEFTARKALQLDDSLADAHIAMSWVCLSHYDWNCADAESARSVALNPESADTHNCRAWMLVALNRMEEAVDERKKAMDIDPFSWPWVLIQTLDENHAFDAAIGEARMRLGANSTNVSLHGELSRTYLLKGMEKEATEELETSLSLDNDKAEAAAVHQAFGRGGYPAVLYMQINELKKQSKTEYVSPMAFASHFGELHRKDETLRYLEEAYQERSPGLAWVQHSPEFDFLHTDKRYRSIIQKMGLPPA